MTADVRMLISERNLLDPAKVKFTLRAKGSFAFLALMIYVAIVMLILAQEGSKLLRYGLELDQADARESALANAGHALMHSIANWQEHSFSLEMSSAIGEQAALDVKLTAAGVEGLSSAYPQFAEDVDKLKRDVGRLRLEPSRANLVALRDHGREMSEHLDQAMRQARAHRSILWSDYRKAHDTMSALAVIMSLLGAVVFGLTMMFFLTRLAWDIRKLTARVLEIVSGYRGSPVRVARHDEIGLLTEAVNSMQCELHQWEQQVEISRQQGFHKEKMAAIGSLATAIAHEINNPIAAIAGIAEFLKGSDRYAHDGVSGIDPCDMILGQTRRIATVSRQLAELTAPQPLEQELLDLNSVVRNTCNFICYDKRFRGIKMELELDSQIPAIRAVGDHITQVLMNLLINAVDALDGIGEPGPKIVVKTEATEGEVVMTVTDNGKGMNSEVLAAAYEESFTTKPGEWGRGQGLFLCKSLIEGGGNRIELESTLGVGTTARIRLMLTPNMELDES